MLRLKNYTSYPSGEYPYVQTEGIYREFPGDGLSIEQQAKRVAEFRSANRLPRPGISEVVHDIDLYTCQRLNGNPQWCHDTDQPTPTPATLIQHGPCAGCGANVT